MELYRFLEKNLKALKRQNAPVASWLEGVDSDPIALEKQLIVNRFGLMDVPLDHGGSLFEAFPPQHYYQSWTPGEEAHRNASIIVGLNLGYGLVQVLQNAPATHRILVVEPRPEMLTACLGLSDYTPFIESGQLAFLSPVESEVYNAAIRLDLQFLHGRVKLLADFPSQQLGPEYARWIRVVRNMLEGITVELNTLRLSQNVMVGNELGNYVRAFRDGSLTPLAGAGQGLTALIVGAGPSLNDFGPELATMQGNALVITSLQTLPALQAAGIKPHLCMAIDYSDGMKKVFNRLDAEWAADIPLIYSTKVSPDVVSRYPGPTLPLWTVGGLATFVLNKTEPVFDAGGNVNVTILRFLSWCGVKKLLLAGQDFSWSAERSHAAGHHAARPTRTYDPARHMKLENMRGETVYSTLAYVTAKRDMEHDIEGLSLDVLNLYGGGLDIAGTKAIGMGEAADALASGQDRVDRFLAILASARQSRPRPVFEARAATWTQSLRAATKRMEKLFRKPVRNRAEIRRLMEQTLFFLRQDPLYLPYLYNESMDLAGLARFTQNPVPADMRRYRDVIARALAKVKEMDAALAAAEGTQAA
ncbi:hypothetical protein GGQ74_001056 [Desulfobaculum xiamenense]|uniref:6-hydroxymethylpterin diphosphokinase MptE-like domain-containing protein n=1 Tax=Desulfobaculum xiamenense TaxID=995050 RepID=A0A846QF63_9BACT|nr:6-hydroxymethylpterin diphosphokinase MptE-like protein [Desulfobaculum xiamenense]NJB67416.1 hypothetical protein [Desulfobaculum xiamenense]